MGESWRELSTKCSVCVECSSLLPSAGWSWRLETGRYLLVPWGAYCRQSNIGHSSRRQDDIWFRFRHQQQQPEIIGMDTESRTCKYFALKRTCSKYVAGRVVNILPHLSLPHSGIAIFCSFRQGWFNSTLIEAVYLFFCYRHRKCRQL